MNILSVLVFGLTFAVGYALKCDCNNCGEGNNTCITDGMCFTEVHKIDNETSYIYSCLNQDQYMPPRDIPFICRDKRFGVQCCSEDYCNRDLLPVPLALKCDCNICGEGNNTCFTDGICFTEARKIDDEISYIYSCLNQDQYLPPRDIPFICRDKRFGVQCCSEDYCNRDLLPVPLGGNCRDLSGVWQNQLGSNMTIVHLSQNHITGEYSTAVESKQRAAIVTSNITGQLVPVSEGALVSFTVLFNHGKSLATWVGQCMVCNDEETLFTSWVLRSHTSKLSDKWMVNTINQDTFKRVRSNYITIPDHLRTQGPKPKDVKSTSCEKHLKVSMNGQWVSGSGDALQFDDCRESGVFSGVNRGNLFMGRKDGGGAFTALGLVAANEDSIKGWAGHIYESSLERNRILETSWLRHSFTNKCKDPRASVQYGMVNYTFVYGYEDTAISDTAVKPQSDWAKKTLNYIFSFF